MAVLRGMFPFCCLPSVLSQWWNPSNPSSQLAVICQLADRAFLQNKEDPLGNYSYVSLKEDKTLELRSLKDLAPFQLAEFITSFFKGSSHMQRIRNQRTWELFKKEIIAKAGRERFDWICRRYKTQLPLKSLESGNPLLVRYIKVFYVGLSQLDVDWIEKQRDQSPPLNWLRRRKLTPFILQFHKEITGLDLSVAKSRGLATLSPRPSGAFLGLGALYHDERTSLSAMWSRLNGFHPIQTKKIENFSSQSPLKTRFLPWLEEFCKDTVNRELMDGQLIPVPAEDGDVDWYQVYARVSAAGLLAYALKPLAFDSSLKPLIVFRPTQREIGAKSAIETLKNDVELKIGSSGWLAARGAFEKLMKDPQFRREGQKIVAAGYSIGGAHLQYFLYQFSDKVIQAFSFNAPSVDQETAKAFANKINRKSDPLSIYIIRSVLDHIPKFGQSHVGCGVDPESGVDVELIEVDFKDPKMGWDQHHTYRAFADNASCIKCIRSKEELLVKLDNSKRGPDVGWYQRLHQKWGWIAFQFFQFLYFVNQLINFITGISDLDGALHYKWRYTEHQK